MDGAVTLERIKKWSACGVKGFVLGTATLFKGDRNFKENLKPLKQQALASERI